MLPETARFAAGSSSPVPQHRRGARGLEPFSPLQPEPPAPSREARGLAIAAHPRGLRGPPATRRHGTAIHPAVDRAPLRRKGESAWLSGPWTPWPSALRNRPRPPAASAREVFEGGAKVPRTLALFPEDRCKGVVPAAVVRLRLRELRLCRPRQWGACWLAQGAALIPFPMEPPLAARREQSVGHEHEQHLIPARALAARQKPLAPLWLWQELRLDEFWADLLGADAALCDIHTLYRCHDRLLEHRRAVFDHLVDR
jgi:hypothetical protein